jgi:hypothetical protein
LFHVGMVLRLVENIVLWHPGTTIDPLVKVVDLSAAPIELFEMFALRHSAICNAVIEQLP